MHALIASLLDGSKYTAKRITTIAVLVVLVLTIVWTVIAYNGVRNEMIAKETRLSAKYQDCQNVLSNYTATIKEALGVAASATSALDTVLTDAIKGRYEGDTTADPRGGALFSAIREAYPNLDGITVNYTNVQSAVFSGRETFKNCNTALLDVARDYKNWKNSGLIHSKMASLAGAPSDNLEARIGADVVYGRAALDRIQRLPLTSEATNAYETGIDSGVNTNIAPPSQPAAPQPGTDTVPPTAPETLPAP